MTSNHLIIKKRVALAVTLVVHINVSGSPGHILLHTRSCGDCCIVAVLCYALHYFVSNYYLNILDAETENSFLSQHKTTGITTVTHICLFAL